MISFQSEYDPEAASSEAWASFCDRLGRQLSIPNPGFLSSYVCQTSNTPPSPETGWEIRVTEGKDAFELQLNLIVNKSSRAVQSLSFPIKESVLNHLEDEGLPVAIARMLVESIPTGWAYTYSTDKLAFDPQEQILPLPADLFIYDLLYDKKEDIWLPRLRARVSRVKDREEGDDGEKVTYALDTSYRPLRNGKTYWVRSAQDPKERQGKYKKMITDSLQGKKALPLPKAPQKKEVEKNFMNDLLLGSFRSSYTGFRYGKSIIDSDSIVTEVDMMSILAEIGSGPLSGLRWYYDVFPEVKRGKGSQEEYFNLRRASLGWAFSFEMPPSLQPFVGKVDVQPKIGLLDLKSHFFTSTPAGNVGLDFNVKNIYDLAVEIGAEKNSPWFRTRLWGAISTANFGVSNKSAVSVKSSRGGIDAYFDLFESGNWDVNLLTFGTVEHLELSKDPKSLDPRTPELYSFSSNIFFAGLGFTISW